MSVTEDTGQPGTSVPEVRPEYINSLSAHTIQVFLFLKSTFKPIQQGKSYNLKLNITLTKCQSNLENSVTPNKLDLQA